MKKINIYILVLGCFFLNIFICSPSASSGEDIQALKQQVEILNKKVAELEAEKSRDPFAEMDRLQEQMNQMLQEPFESRFGQNQPVMPRQEFYDPDFNLEETPDGYLVKFNTAGLDNRKIDIQVNENSLTLSGESSSETEENSPAAVLRSRSYGKFLKTIPLPVDADTQKLKTEQKGDILEIQIPKKKINS